MTSAQGAGIIKQETIPIQYTFQNPGEKGSWSAAVPPAWPGWEGKGILDQERAVCFERTHFAAGGHHQKLWRHSRAGRHPPGGRAGGIYHVAGVLRLWKNHHPADHRRAGDAGRGQGVAGGTGHGRGCPQPPGREHGVSELRSVPPHERGAEYRLCLEDPQAAQGRNQSRSEEHAGAGTAFRL